MSLKRNIFANYASQIYLTLIGILLIPMYIKYMGAEAYGLIGFFSMLQAWFNLLDLGLSPTISRESARYHGGSMTAIEYRRLFRALNIIFLSIAALGCIILLYSSQAIATNWLKFTSLPHNDVVFAVQIMAVSVALRWMNGLYRGVLSGAERLLWISGFTALIATLRFIGVFLSMWLCGYTARVFFIHQLIVAGLEVGGFYLMSRELLPKTHDLDTKIGWSFQPVQPLLKFSLTLAFTSSVWIIVTQTDKLILSGILSLAEYGYFTVAVLVANSITIIGGPISNAIMPRMARLHAEKKYKEIIDIYRQSTQWISIITGSVTITLVFYSKPLIFAWSGDYELANHTAPILILYAIGNGFLSIAAFPYYLQYAKGNMRLHMIGSAIMVSILIPSIYYAASNFGALGAGWVWLGINTIYFFTWLPYVHYRLEPGMHWSWLRRDVINILIPAIIIAFAISLIPLNFYEQRVITLIYISLTGVITLTTAAIMSPTTRKIIVNILLLNPRKSPNQI